jgi:nucleoside 2-deoxyribosyltransferase
MPKRLDITEAAPPAIPSLRVYKFPEAQEAMVGPELTVYLARQITGLSFAEVEAAYEDLKSRVSALGFKVLQAMTGKKDLAGHQNLSACGIGRPLSTDHAIAQRDRWMVRQSDLVLMDLRGTTRISIGCCMELAWAFEMGKHNIVVLEPDNLHHHAFIHDCAHVIYETLEDALNYLGKLARQEI